MQQKFFLVDMYFNYVATVCSITSTDTTPTDKVHKRSRTKKADVCKRQKKGGM